MTKHEAARRDLTERARVLAKSLESNIMMYAGGLSELAGSADQSPEFEQRIFTEMQALAFQISQEMSQLYGMHHEAEEIFRQRA